MTIVQQSAIGAKLSPETQRTQQIFNNLQ